MTSDRLTPCQLPPPDWSSVRSIYKKLSEEFHLLTTPFGIQLNEERKIMLDHLIISIDAVDKFIDEMPSKEERVELSDAIRHTFKEADAHWHHPLASDGLAAHISLLKQIVLSIGAQQRFAKATSKIFRYTEEKRHVGHSNKLISLVQKEGYATGELPLTIMGVERMHPFGIFFSKLCMLMGIADLIIDAQSDYESNYTLTFS